MRRRRVLAVLGGAVAMFGAAALAAGCTGGGRSVPAAGRSVPAVSGAVPAAGSPGTAIEVPGLAALSEGQSAAVTTVSCGSAGNCAAGGYYTHLPNIVVPILATEREGRWGKAVALPGNGAVDSISCASGGSCLAGGGMAGENEYFFVGDAYVVQQRAGGWEPVKFVPGLRNLEHGGDRQVTGSWTNSVACPPAGNCAAGGGYAGRSGRQGAFVAVGRDGRWGPAIQLPGLAVLNAGGGAEVTSVSCGLAGNCAVIGFYTDRSGHHQGFLTQAS